MLPSQPARKNYPQINSAAVQEQNSNSSANRKRLLNTEMLVATETSPRYLHSKTPAPVKAQRITDTILTCLLKCEAIRRKNVAERKHTLHNLEQQLPFSFSSLLQVRCNIFPFFFNLSDQSKTIPQARTDKVTVRRFSITGHRRHFTTVFLCTSASPSRL